MQKLFTPTSLGAVCCVLWGRSTLRLSQRGAIHNNTVSNLPAAAAPVACHRSNQTPAVAGKGARQAAGAGLDAAMRQQVGAWCKPHAVIKLVVITPLPLAGGRSGSFS
jgi:hypothetical protein